MDFTLVPDRPPESFSYELMCQQAKFRVPTSKIGFQSSVQGAGSFSLQESPHIEGRFSFDAGQFTNSERTVFIEKIGLFFSSKLQVNNNILIVPDLRVDIPSYVHLNCPLSILLQDNAKVHFHPRIQIDTFSKIFSLVRPYIPYRIDSLEVEGSLSMEGEGRFYPKQIKEKINISGTVDLNPTHVKYKASLFSLDSNLSGRLRIKDFPLNTNISGRLKSTDGIYSLKGLKLSGVSLEIPLEFSSRASKVDLSHLNARFKNVTYHLWNKEIKIDDVTVQASGLIDIQKKHMILSQARMQFPPFPSFHLTASAGPNAGEIKSLSLKASDISFSRLLAFLSPFLPQKVNDWEPAGMLSFQLKAQNSFQNKNEVWHINTQIKTSGVAFQDPSLSFAGESLKPNLTLKADLSPPLNDIPFSAAINLSDGESLWKDTYFNWNTMPLQGRMSGRLLVPQRKLAGLSAEVSIPDFAKVAAKGSLEILKPHSMNLSVTASELQLSSLYSFFLQRYAEGKVPLEIRGEAESSVDVQNNKNGLSVKGKAEIRHGAIGTGNKTFLIKEVNVDIPLNYRRDIHLKEVTAFPPEIGFISFGEIHVPYLDSFSLKLDILSQPNRYIIDPFEIEIFGKKASIGKIFLDLEPQKAGFEGQTSLFWEGVEIAHLPFQAKPSQLQGKLWVSLPRVGLLPSKITTTGESNIEIFGGKVTIKNLQVQEPFSKERAFSFDAQFRDLNLEKVTDLIPFGRVTGIINGEIDDLIFAYGQPEHFNLKAESEKKKGVSQKFSLKAANDLAILGTGEKTQFSSNSGWTRIVNSFNYKKIGISCALKNDMFSLRGTIHEGGVEYLVKGSWLFGINVVNKHPQNKIQFKDLLSRLKRIGQSRQRQ
jgi:hypothetical protein